MFKIIFWFRRHTQVFASTREKFQQLFQFLCTDASPSATQGLSIKVSLCISSSPTAYTILLSFSPSIIVHSTTLIIVPPSLLSTSIIIHVSTIIFVFWMPFRYPTTVQHLSFMCPLSPQALHTTFSAAPLLYIAEDSIGAFIGFKIFR